MVEQWKDIKGYEGYYQISNMGKVKSIKHKIKILKGSLNTQGYHQISLSRNGKSKTFRINRLVAQHFISNPNNFPIVNHIDGNKLNNYADNLEWCTCSENIKHAYKNNLRTNNFKGKFGKDNSHSKKIYQVDKITNKVIKIFYGAREAERHTKIRANCITMCCKEQRKTAGGYIWKYANTK